jgi:tetratricopeptide (TPR) repeat protein
VQIQNSSILGLAGLYGLGGTTTTGASTGATASATSLFGPAAVLSLNGAGMTGAVSNVDLNAAAVSLFGSGTLGVAGTAYGVSTSTGTSLQQSISPQQQEQEARALEQAFELLNAGEPGNARAVVESVLAQNKTSAAGTHALGYIEMSTGAYEKAEQLFLKAHALNPTVGYDNDAHNARILTGDDQSVYSTAQAMMKAPAKQAEGIRLLISLTERSPDNAAAHMALGDAMLAQGDALNGLMQFNAAIRSADTGELGALETRLTDLADRNSGSAFLRQLVGKVQTRQGRYDDAIVNLKQAEAMADDPTGTQRDLAAAYVGLGRDKLAHSDINGAMSLFETAKRYDPTHRDTKLALAEGYVARAEKRARQADYEEAASDYSRLVTMLAGQHDVEDLRERAAHGAYSVGKSLQRRREAAGEQIGSEATAYQAAHDLDSDNKTYKRVLAETRYAIGLEHEELGEYEEAGHAFRRAFELDEHNDTYRDAAIGAFKAWGDERLASHNFTDAVNAYRLAFEIDTDNETSRSDLATAYFARGNDWVSWEKYEDAARDFREAVRLMPGNTAYEDLYNHYSAYLDD